MESYKKIPTTDAVWKSITLQHHTEMVVFESFSAPYGDGMFGDPNQGRMETAYGFRHAPIPTIYAKTTWDIISLWHRRDSVQHRINEVHEYWLCVPVEST